MLHRTLTEEFPLAMLSRASFLQRSTPCDQTALIRLTKAFNEAKPAAILIGDGKARSTQVVDRFLNSLDDRTCVVRVPTPCTDPTSCMRSVVYSIGFDPKDFGLNDLENIFKMFLGHQRSHGRRTVICIEDAHVCETWVLNKVYELTELETEEQYGLFVILSGQREMQDLLYQKPLQNVVALVGRHIPVSPLGPAETKEFVSQQIQSEHSRDVSEIIKFEAITCLHEIGAGVPDTVSQLCCKSMELAAEESVYPITPHVVKRAACTLGLISDDTAITVELKGINSDNIPHKSDCLIIKLGDHTFGERMLDSECVSIGRDSKNDLCIPSLAVSRLHVLIVTSSKGVNVMDLGSTNGTFVNGEKIKSGPIKHGDNIRLGDCHIEYVAAKSDSSAMLTGQLSDSRRPRANSVPPLFRQRSMTANIRANYLNPVSDI